MSISTYGDLKGELSAYLFHRGCCRAMTTARNFLRPTPIRGCGCCRWRRDAAHHRQRRCGTCRSTIWLWRTVRPTFAMTRRSRRCSRRRLTKSTMCIRPICRRWAAASIGCSPSRAITFKARPVDDRADAYEFHYYQKIPTLAGSDLNSNWLLAEYPNAYLFGADDGSSPASSAILEMAQLYKARRDEVFRGNHPALCAHHRRHQPDSANRGVFLMPKIFDGDGNEIADFELSDKQQRSAGSRRRNRDDVSYAADAALSAGRAHRDHSCCASIGDQIVAHDAGRCAQICRSAARHQSRARAS